MLRKLFGVFAIACLAGTFVACGGAGAPKKDKDIESKKPDTSDVAPADGDEDNDTTKSIEQ